MAWRGKRIRRSTFADRKGGTSHGWLHVGLAFTSADHPLYIWIVDMQVYALGSNGSGQLGIGHKDDASIPSRLKVPASLANDEIVNIASGGNHTLICTASGAVYGTGSNDGGALMSSEAEYERVFKIDLSPIKLCAATWDASIFVTTDDRVLTTGTGVRGELGSGPDVKQWCFASLLPEFPPNGLSVIDLSASMGHVVTILSDGSAWGWGNGKQGQLGEPHQDSWTPRKMQEVTFPAVRVVCGKSFSCFFSGTDQGQVCLLGNSKSDRFALTTTLPKQIPRWHQVTASWGSALILLDDGKLLRYGRNDRGQLGPDDVPLLSQIRAGSEHVVAVTRDGRALTWGWGEHGNCGEPVDDQKDVKGKFNQFDIPGRIKFVHAGCATSFVVTEEG